jgi:hypothetical protein
MSEKTPEINLDSSAEGRALEAVDGMKQVPVGPTLGLRSECRVSPILDIPKIYGEAAYSEGDASDDHKGHYDSHIKGLQAVASAASSEWRECAREMKDALSLCNIWLANSIPTYDIPGDKPLPVLRKAMAHFDSLDKQERKSTAPPVESPPTDRKNPPLSSPES